MNRDVNIRPMMLEDVPACRIVVAECWDRSAAQASETDLRETFASSSWRPTYYVAAIGDKIVGLVGYNTSWIATGVYNIISLGVRPDYRRQGTAKDLMNRCMDDLIPIANSIMLVTGIPKFYSRWGFESLTHLPNPSSFGETLMVRKYHQVHSGEKKVG